VEVLRTLMNKSLTLQESITLVILMFLQGFHKILMVLHPTWSLNILIPPIQMQVR